MVQPQVMRSSSFTSLPTLEVDNRSLEFERNSKTLFHGFQCLTVCLRVPCHGRAARHTGIVITERLFRFLID